MTWEPTMFAQVFKVKTFRMKGLLSPSSRLMELERSHSMRSHTLTRHHVRNLNNWIDIRLGKDTFAARTLDIETEDTKRRDF